MIRLGIIVSDVNRSLHFEWLAQHLPSNGFELFFLLLHPTRPDLFKSLKFHNAQVSWIPTKSKWNRIFNLFRICTWIISIRPEIVHTHLWEASWLGLIAARICGVRKRFYTRHHGALHHLYFPRAVWYDKLLNMQATRIIALSKSHFELLRDKEGVKEKKLFIVPYGFDVEYFKSVRSSEVDALREKYKIPEDSWVIGTIARYTHWKGIHCIVPAVKAIMQDTKIFWVLANVGGDYEFEIRKKLGNLPVGSFIEIPFESNIAALYRTFDVFVHTPIHPVAESYGQVYPEALISGVPSVFTRSGILADIKLGGFLEVPYKDSKAIEKAIRKIIYNPKNLFSFEKEKEFSIPTMIEKLTSIYQL